MAIQAPPRVVFDAISTLQGPRLWWTTLVNGSAEPGGTLTFGFAGLEEQIVMQVDAVEPVTLVVWTCTSHNRDEEWTGSSLRFTLSSSTAGQCELKFRHDGIAATVVATGWDHFLTSLAAYAERGIGTPFGA